MSSNGKLTRLTVALLVMSLEIASVLQSCLMYQICTYVEAGRSLAELDFLVSNAIAPKALSRSRDTHVGAVRSHPAAAAGCSNPTCW